MLLGWTTNRGNNDPLHRPLALRNASMIALASQQGVDCELMSALSASETRVATQLGASRVLAANTDFERWTSGWFQHVSVSAAELQAPSSEFQMALLALAMCDQVQLFGFQPELPRQLKHYWEGSVPDGCSVFKNSTG